MADSPLSACGTAIVSSAYRLSLKHRITHNMAHESAVLVVVRYRAGMVIGHTQTQIKHQTSDGTILLR
jgi:hypothetical protein